MFLKFFIYLTMKKQPKQIEPKRPVDVYFDKYQESHNDHTNEIIHWICVPLIMFSLLGLVWNIPFPHLEFLGRYNGFFNWASILIAFVLYYYFTLSPMLAFLMIWVIAIMSYFIVQIELVAGLGSASSYAIYVVIFVAAWIGQFIGHKIEGKKPSFLDDLRFLLIGPIWLLHFICLRLGLRY